MSETQHSVSIRVYLFVPSFMNEDSSHTFPCEQQYSFMQFFWDSAVVCDHDKEPQLQLKEFSGVRERVSVDHLWDNESVLVVFVGIVMKENEEYYTVP